MTEIKELKEEDKSSSSSEESVLSERIRQIEQEEINPTIYYKEILKKIDQEDKKYKDKIVNQLEALIRGDTSIFTIYKPSATIQSVGENNQVPNILKLNSED